MIDWEHQEQPASWTRRFGQALAKGVGFVIAVLLVLWLLGMIVLGLIVTTQGAWRLMTHG